VIATAKAIRFRSPDVPFCSEYTTLSAKLPPLSFIFVVKSFGIVLIDPDFFPLVCDL